MLILCVATSSLLGQLQFSKNDFTVGRIGIDELVDSTLQELGQPKDTNFIEDEEYRAFVEDHFDGITLWTVKATRAISAFDMSTSKLATTRGLRVGDSIRKLNALYG